MFTGYQVLALLLQFIVTIIAVWGVVSKSQSSVKAELRAAIDTLSDAHGKSADESRQQFSSMSEDMKKVGLQINTILEGEVRELRTRVSRLESGQDEWTKELRHRTHDLSGKVDQLGFAIELMKAKHGDGAKA
jgi:hypothetical protein